jgi:hypothetical protein
MAKHSSHRRRSQSKTRTRRQGQHGGNLAGNPPSSWGWGLGTAGNGWTQFMNSLTLQPTANVATIQSNQLVPVGNINADNTQGMIGTNLKGDIPGQAGGKKRRRSKSRSNTRSNTRSRRGGSWGAILGQAAVPGVLLAAQQTFGKSRRQKH